MSAGLRLHIHEILSQSSKDNQALLNAKTGTILPLTQLTPFSSSGEVPVVQEGATEAGESIGATVKCGRSAAEALFKKPFAFFKPLPFFNNLFSINYSNLGSHSRFLGLSSRSHLTLASPISRWPVPSYAHGFYLSSRVSTLDSQIAGLDSRFSDRGSRLSLSDYGSRLLLSLRLLAFDS
jgi:hypothetical protein